MGRDKGSDLRIALQASVISKRKKALKWFQESPAVKFAHEQIAQGATRKEVLDKLSELYDTDPIMWGTNQGKRVTKGTLSHWLSKKNPKEIQEIDFDEIEKEATEIPKATEVLEPKATKKTSGKRKTNQSTRSRLSAEEEKRQKQEWLHNSEACKFVRSLFESYKTRYLLAAAKIELFNQRYELRSGNKITSPAQWSVLTKELGLSGIPTGAYQKIEFLHKWAIESSKDLVEVKIVERIRTNGVDGYVITPTDVEINLMELHSWLSFLEGLFLDGIVTETSKTGDLPTYRFISKEIVNKILKDMER